MQRLSYISVPRQTPYKYSSLIDAFKENVGKYPEKEIAIQRDSRNVRRVLSYLELDESATKLARYLVHYGVKKGDHIGILGPNTLEWIVGELGIIMAGAVSVHLTINTKNTKDIWTSLAKANCKALVLDFGEKNELQDVIKALLSPYHEPPQDTTEEKQPPLIIFLRHSEEYAKFPDLSNIQKEKNVLATLPTIFPEDTAVIFPTSGSTGEPKLLKLSHFSFLNGFDIFQTTIDSDLAKFYDDRPFSWLGGYPVINMSVGNSLVFTDASLALSADSTSIIWNIMKNENCSHALLMPYFLSDLLQNEAQYKNDLWRLDTIMSGGQVVDSSHANVIGKFCDKLMIGYGSSEALCISIGKPISDPKLFETGNVGCLFPGTEVKIIADDGNPTKQGQVGKILCRSRYMFQGYYRFDDLASDIPLYDGDWLDTGDIGLINPLEEIIIKGRAKDIISRGTRKIIPSPIEDIMLKMPHIKNVAVIAVPDSRLYEEVCVCYATDHTQTVSPVDVENFCKSHFLVEGSYDGLGDMPTYFLHFDKIPLLSNGKANKNKLKEEAVARLKL